MSFPSWEDAAAHLLPTEFASSYFFRHDDGFTLTYPQVLMRSLKSRARNQSKVNCPHKNGVCDIGLIDQTFQPAELIFMYQITKRTDILKREDYIWL